MADKIELEEFNSTEINIEDIKKSDKNDDWEIVSKFEADTCSVPFISVPKMHEVVEESDSILYGTSIESDKQGTPGEFSLPKNERERKDEAKNEQLLPYQQYEERENLIDEAMKDKFFQLDKEQKTEKIGKEIYEAMQDISLPSRQGPDYEKVRRAMDEAIHDDPPVEENKTVRTKINELMQYVLQKEQENERVRREMEEAMNEMIGEKENAVAKENTNTENSAGCVKSQSHTIECESLAKARTESGCQVAQREFIETFHKILDFNTVVPDKVSTETAKDKFEKEKDLRVKISSKDMESLLNEEFDNPSAKECKKM